MIVGNHIIESKDGSQAVAGLCRAITWRRIFGALRVHWAVEFGKLLVEFRKTVVEIGKIYIYREIQRVSERSVEKTTTSIGFASAAGRNFILRRGIGIHLQLDIAISIFLDHQFRPNFDMLSRPDVVVAIDLNGFGAGITGPTSTEVSA